ncbi:MAG: DUF1080 domain-containing protein [Bacteroidales bacterium]|nr:DUF1080 domain-containing protein [Bacteroidales bacterium]
MKIYLLVIVLLFSGSTVFSQGEVPDLFEESDSYPLIGNWEGQWINPQIGYEKTHPALAAQIDIADENLYIVRILPVLYKRAPLFLEVEVPLLNSELTCNKDGWNFRFAGDRCTGYGFLYGDTVQFTLTKRREVPPTLGLQAPEQAVKLLDGTGLSYWKHTDGREVTWKIDPSGVLETVSEFWNNGENRSQGIGGSIETIQKFGDLQFHMEFRYPLEAGKKGQGRGNSGLFFSGIGEIQILNSFALPGYWDEGGAIYKRFPPMVNAAGPPLQWQTYNVELSLPEYHSATGEKISNAFLTVYLNGVLIHNKIEIETDVTAVSIGLQDHINRLQYRNIWVLEK